MFPVHGLDVFRELRPALEGMFAGDDQLGVGQRELRAEKLGFR